MALVFISALVFSPAGKKLYEPTKELNEFRTVKEDERCWAGMIKK